VHHVGILYDQFMMHGQRNIKLLKHSLAWIQLVRNKAQWRAVVSTAMNLQVLQKADNFWPGEPLSASPGGLCCT